MPAIFRNLRAIKRKVYSDFLSNKIGNKNELSWKYSAFQHSGLFHLPILKSISWVPN